MRVPVLLTPAESAELHCLDLRRGAPLWRQPRRDRLHVAGILTEAILSFLGVGLPLHRRLQLLLPALDLAFLHDDLLLELLEPHEEPDGERDGLVEEALNFLELLFLFELPPDHLLG